MKRWRDRGGKKGRWRGAVQRREGSGWEDRSWLIAVKTSG